ncbi:TIGR03086 family protein [Nocardia terpenica]|uniref:TIGR03086 family metal-binding protein n=2 Tax=Nocardia terpenica TaxID=455432 RepID=UPI00189442B2|nr:TIGR03086 family metal-binding protein [Nocardia terpenica]MBF6064894.1 TIGR03086 family protein [Nocardia terpenica]MBF6107409.1 TIGR03086 family protein [Nocardia terpenica]MBF6115166.1 TIGR03086 family protein [Nocardia terpenica]MBF6122272.1 TIGR03086 family protein [Nocardia terpenica]MBF6154655.1 TIGR03086 family protein [Nocardia terpenica]
MMTNIIELNRRAVEHSVQIVSRLTPADLDRPTPCAAWKLGDLLQHMIAQHRGFAAAARGNGADPEVWEVRPLADDPAAEYADAAADVLAAFAEPGALERDFALPEVAPGFTAPGSQVLGFHLVDYVVHAWDVARALGIEYRLDEELAGYTLEVALAVPDDEHRTQPGASFAPVVPVRDSADAMDRILGALGRSPQWPN